MSEIQPAEPARLTVLSAEQIREAVAKPTRLLPADWRPVVWEWWAGWSHLIEHQLPIAIRLRRAIADHGLTLDELRQIFRAMNAPAREAAIRFKGDLLAELAGEIEQAVKRRRNQAAAATRRAEAEAGEQVRTALKVSGWTPAGAP